MVRMLSQPLLDPEVEQCQLTGDSRVDSGRTVLLRVKLNLVTNLKTSADSHEEVDRKHEYSNHQEHADH